MQILFVFDNGSKVQYVHIYIFSRKQQYTVPRKTTTFVFNLDEILSI